MAGETGTLRDFYAAAGGDYDKVIGRLRTEERVRKFLRMFGADESYAKLVAGAETGDNDACFRSSHTLKGISGDMGLLALSAAAGEACECFRAGDFAGGVDKMAPVTEAYQRFQAAALQYL